MSDAYLDLVMGTQALRREVERDAVDLFGALGVAAWRLPHQIANVARVLTATRVRHLLADEVGLGKTVQALMILNALRAQSRGTLRALIVVPDELVAQWRDELLCRGHEAPDQDGGQTAGDEERRAVRFAWPGRMVASDIDPARYDLLIVDELHALPKEHQARISRQGPLFAHVLLLTATPPFHDPVRLVDLLRILEPARIAAAEAVNPDPSQVLTWLRDKEHTVARLVEAGGGDWDAWRSLGGAPPPESVASSAAQAHCVLRSVARTRRADWPEILPTREVHVLAAEPTEAEVERQRLIWRFFEHLGDLDRDFDQDLLAQRALRSPASLRQRVTYLRGHGHERDGLLAQVGPLLDRALGDSRLDALCDLLAGIWEREPNARILVAAGDNLTVDDLFDRLPDMLGRVGPAEKRVELRPTKVRNQTKAVESPSDSEHDIEDAVSRFRKGDANLLLAAEVGKVGLNLQWTRHLVLYSVPWDPQDVEQWIGRVDRIGNPTLRDDEGALDPIRIYAIAWRGLVDERVLDVIRAAGVLERSVSLDGEAVQTVKAAIRAAALSDDPDGWRRLLSQAGALARGSELDVDAAPLTRWLPWTAEAGLKLYRQLRKTRAVEPVVGERRRDDGFHDREEALLAWLFAAQKAGLYALTRIGGPERVRVMAYPEIAAGIGGARVTVANLPHPQGALTSLLPTLTKKVFFLARRDELGSPPLRQIVGAPGQPRYVHFLDHGSHLHDELTQTWIHVGAQGREIFGVRFQAHHPASGLSGGWIRLLIASWSARALLPRQSDEADPPLRAAQLADERFLGMYLPARLLVCATMVSATGTSPLPEEMALALLRPQGREGDPWPWCDDVQAPGWITRALLDEVDRSLLAQAANSVHEHGADGLAALRAAVEERRYILAVEAHALAQVPGRGLPVELRASFAGEADANGARRAWLDGVDATLTTSQPSVFRKVLIRIR